MELTAARDLSRFIEKIHANDRGRCMWRPNVRYSRAFAGEPKIPEFTGRTAERNSFPPVGAPLGGTLQVALTSARLIGMIRGL
ncbi:hypothetical protein, partial [Pseudomonas sp. UBA6315]|uniref:hypothetical protein n=1 Tax=Pseudomonas sp. UBA6315 TaxID=1947328 RepID=UPI00257DC1FA